MLFRVNIFSAGFRPPLSKIGGSTAAKSSGQSPLFYGRFCVILQNFRPAGNSGFHLRVVYNEAQGCRKSKL
jgi:hypothetical protein